MGRRIEHKTSSIGIEACSSLSSKIQIFEIEIENLDRFEEDLRWFELKLELNSKYKMNMEEDKMYTHIVSSCIIFLSHMYLLFIPCTLVFEIHMLQREFWLQISPNHLWSSLNYAYCIIHLFSMDYNYIHWKKKPFS